MIKKVVQWWQEQTQRGKHFLAALVPGGIIFIVASILLALGKIDNGQFILGGAGGGVGWMSIFSFVNYKHSSRLD